MIQLRPRQIIAIDKARKSLREGKKNIMLVGPPGTGKATIISAISASAVSKGGRVAGWVHKRSLVFDLKSRMREQFGVGAGLILHKHPVEKDQKVQVISVLSGIRRDLSWFKPTLLFSDEAHRRLTGSQDTIHKMFPDAPLLSFTATPFRTSKSRKFSEVYDEFIQISTYREEMNDRFLMPTRVIAPKGAASMEGVKLKRSYGELDYDVDEMAERFSQYRLYSSLLSEWTKYTGRKFSTMVFNINKAHNIEVCNFFKKHGVRAEYVDEDTPYAERDRITNKFKEGPFADNPILVLCNIAIFGEGEDAPHTKCVILNYATKSLSKYVQSSARGSRPVWEKDYSDWLKINGKYYKEEVIIIDCGANWSRHGFIEDYDQWGFDMDDEKPKGDPPVKSCPECDHVVYASVMTCPECGYVFPKKPKKNEKLHGDEVEWGEIQKDQALQKKIIGLKRPQAERSETQWLRIVALVKSYDRSWVYKRVMERAEFPGQVFEHKRVDAWLDELEREKGTAAIYQRLESKRISI